MAKALDKNEDKNELVAQQEAGLLDLSQLDDVDIEFTGLEEIGQGDIKLGKWKLLQPTSAEVTKDIPPGSFYNTVTKEVREELIVTVLKTGKSRVMFPEKYRKGDKAQCRSVDFIRKTEGLADAGPICENCKYSKWEEGEKSRCSIVYYFIGLDDTDTPFRIQFRGASVPPVKDFLSQVYMTLKKANKGIFSFKIKITADYKSDDKGNYYIAVPSPAKNEEGKLIVPSKEQYINYAETAKFLSEFYASHLKDSENFANEYGEAVDVEATDVTDGENSALY